MIRVFIFLFSIIVLAKELNGQVVANFDADSLEACDILAGVKFTDLSTGNVTSWEWNFGNGSNSTLQNPTASYVLPGSYDVQLVVSDGISFDTLILEDYIIVHESPKVNYIVDTTRGCAPLEVLFIDSSQSGSSPIVERVWDFGDGATSIGGTTEKHLFLNGGNFSTGLTVKDAEGCKDIKNKDVISVIETPIATFSSKNSSKTCEDSLIVEFINSTLNHSPSVNYEWFFGDGTKSNLRNPTKKYTTLGSYDVKLVATNGVCKDSITIKDFVNLGRNKASFSLKKDVYCFKARVIFDGEELVPDTIRDTVHFINLSVGGDNYLWDFGDGTTSTEKNPFHLYKDSGWYNVNLRVSLGTNCVSDTTIRVYGESVYAKYPIRPGMPKIYKTYSETCILPDTFYFEDTSINAVNWEWRFQTDTTPLIKTGQNVFIAQNVMGRFIDTLIVTGSRGCMDTLIMNDPSTNAYPNRLVAIPGLRIAADTNQDGCTPIVLNFIDMGFSNIGSPRPANIISGTKLWDFGNGQTSILDTPETQTYIKDTVYTVTLTATDTLGCRQTVQTTVRVGELTDPKIIIVEDSICIQGDTIKLEEVSGNREIEHWEWVFLENPDDTAYQELSFSRQVNMPIEEFISRKVKSRDTTIGSYGIALIASYHNCPDTVKLEPDLFVLGPQAKPYFEIDSCGGYQVNFFTQAIDADTYLWDFGDSTTSDTNNPTHVFPRSGRFKQKYTIGNSITGCEISDSFNLGISPIVPGIIVQDTIGCSPFQLSMRGNDNRFVSYVWELEDSALSFEKEFDTTLTNSGIYVFKFSIVNGFGCNRGLFQTIIVNGSEAEIGIEPLNECLPYQVAFRDQTDYSPSIFKSRKWDFGNGLFSNRAFETTQYSQRDSLYSVTLYIEDNDGCKDTLTYKDTILTPDILVDFSAVDDSLCLGEEVELINLSYGDNNPVYTWLMGDGIVSNEQNMVKHLYQNEEVFDVSLKMKDDTGCEIETTKVISVQDKPIVGFTADTLNANCFPLRVNFTDTSKSDYLAEWIWDFGAAGKAFFQNSSKLFNNRGSYDVSLTAITSNGCTDSLTKPAYINIDGPDASFTISEDTVCKFEDVTFTIQDSVGVGSFSWDFGDGNTGTGSPITYQYKRRAGVIKPVLLLSDASEECFKAIVDSLFVEDVIASFEVDDTIGCEPHSINITNNSQRADELGWDFGEGNSSLDLNPSNIYLTNGIYEIVLNIRNQNGCVDTAYQTIVVQAQPIVETSNDTTICEGDTITLFSRGGAVYRWSPNPDTNIIGRFLAEPRIFPVENTFYNVEVFTSEGCLDSGQVQVDVQPKPEEYTLIEDTTLIIGEELALDVESGPSYSYMWSPNEWINCIDCPTPIVQPLATTIYMVDINDPFNCFPKKDSINIEVIVDFSIAVPEAFSPNNDGVNDIIYVKGWGIKELLEFKIYNRWGELVFETNDINKGWDGTYRGVPQNIETYVYTISVNTHLDEVLTKRGNISLLR